jgi:hypothetical protein
VRQKFFCSGAGGIQPDAWSMGIGSLRKGINFRKGTVTWEKNQQKWALKKLIF